MMFSSRPPFNDDPKPWRCTSCSDRFVKEQRSPTSHVTKHQPRVKFDRPQNNPTNPILAELREGVSADASNDWVATYLATLPDWKEGEVGHARRVLTRLTRFAEVNA